jgi:uncharacterized protein YukE
MFTSISQTLESAGQSVQQALSGLGGAWQGDSATAATTKTSDALANGAAVSGQATDLRASLTAATTSVQQAEARLIEIVNEFYAKLAAIGPSIIFPWGIAAAIEAATHAVTMSVEVMTETQTTLAAESGETAAAGEPVAAMAAAPASTAAGSGLGQAFGPAVQMASSLASPVVQGVSTVTGAIQSAVQKPTDSTEDDKPEDGKPEDGKPEGDPKGGMAGGAGGGAGGGVGGKAMLAHAQPNVAVPGESAATQPAGPRAQSGPGMGGSPMMGGGPHGQGAKGGADSGHSAASFLHTSDQGGEIVGDLGSVAPPVIGELDARLRPDVELRI